MRVRIVVLSAGRRESVELDVEASSKVRDVKENLCKKFSLVTDDHVLERVLHVSMPAIAELSLIRPANSFTLAVMQPSELPLPSTKTGRSQNIRYQVLMSWCSRGSVMPTHAAGCAGVG
jgi:hypothetical protein